MPKSISLNSRHAYEIKIYGQVDEAWLDWFGKAQVSVNDNQVTTLSNVIMDQAGLVGLIRRLHGLGIVLLSVRLV